MCLVHKNITTVAIETTTSNNNNIIIICSSRATYLLFKREKFPSGS